MFPEEFLHFIWQFQYYDAAGLQTTDGQPVAVVQPGFWNRDAGPDFTQARIRIGDIDWHGHIEIHLKSSDWNNHQHQSDAAYDNVVLHVVWEKDREVYRKDGTPLPQLELKNRVALELLAKYQDLVQQRVDVPCQTYRARIEPLKARSMLDRAVVERLQRKVKEIVLMLEKLGGDWDATALHLLIRYFGFKKNEDAFRQLSHRVSFKVMHKLSAGLLDLEAYLFGTAGFFNSEPTDSYARALARSFAYSTHKYELKPSGMSAAQWKFMRMRPANFPTLRLAQLAAIVHRSPRLFAAFLATEGLEAIKKLLDAEVSDYWRTHYKFDEQEGSKATGERHFAMGDGSKEILIINCVAPLLFAYGRQQGNSQLEERALDLLNKLKFESNSVTARFRFFPVHPSSAYESQAFIELYNFYCMPRKCLSCQVGIDLVR